MRAGSPRAWRQRCAALGLATLLATVAGGSWIEGRAADGSGPPAVVPEWGWPPTPRPSPTPTSTPRPKPTPTPTAKPPPAPTPSPSATPAPTPAPRPAPIHPPPAPPPPPHHALISAHAATAVGAAAPPPPAAAAPSPSPTAAGGGGPGAGALLGGLATIPKALLSLQADPRTHQLRADVIAAELLVGCSLVLSLLLLELRRRRLV